LFARLLAGGHDSRALAGARIASIGPGTTRALLAHGIAAEIEPQRFVAEGLIEALAGVDAKRALIARARGGRELLPDALRERGIGVDVLDLYETVVEPLDAATLARAAAADYITFTSGSTVRNFLDAAARGDGAGDGGRGDDGDGDGDGRAMLSPQTRIVSIGPVTSETLRERGLQADVEATEHDIDGLLQALLADAAARRG
jgi:uroporphyrinogen III methyltransferase/synthase